MPERLALDDLVEELSDNVSFGAGNPCIRYRVIELWKVARGSDDPHYNGVWRASASRERRAHSSSIYLVHMCPWKGMDYV